MINEVTDEQLGEMFEAITGSRPSMSAILELRKVEDRRIKNIERTKKLEEENKQLKEALKIANPWCMSDATCRFCNGQFDHTEDCKYVLLTNKSGGGVGG